MKKEKINESSEGYIGRPKPMKMKKLKKTLTAKFYVELSVAVLFALFIVYIGIRLFSKQETKADRFSYYTLQESDAHKTLRLENDKLLFCLDTDTTNFTILQKSTGRVWKSSPDGIDDDFSLLKTKNDMKSPFLIQYSTVNGVDNTYDTYSYSVEKKFYSVEESSDSVTVNYAIGEIERSYVYPFVISENTMNGYLERMSPENARFVKQNYKKYDINNLLPSDDKNELLSKYPSLKNTILYEVRETGTQKWIKEKVELIFEEIGYTMEEYEEDKKMYRGAKEKNVPMFNLSVIYRLDGNDFTVEVPFDRIASKPDYPPVKLSILPYFGSSSVSDDGFIFVPEGSGSLIKFNNGKIKQNSYYADVYGWDSATDRKALITETRTSFPVFGISYNDSSFISIMEEGKEYAGINADISGKFGSYNYVYADYKLFHREQFDVSTRNINTQYAYEQNLPEGEKIIQRYRFIDKGDYSSMAKSYRNYLFDKKDKTVNETIPLAVEIVGAVDKVQQSIGVPKSRPYSLTTYKEALNIIREIDELGIKGADIKLTGMINSGFKQKALKKTKFINELGGKRDFRKMMKESENLSSHLYLDGVTQFAYQSGVKDGFNRFSDPARFVSSEICKMYEYSPIWYGKEKSLDEYYLLSPAVSEEVAAALEEGVLKYAFDGISYRENGYMLSSDFNKKHKKSRFEVRKMQDNQLKNAKDKKLKVMINAGNDYAVTEADFVTNMVLHGNDYAIIDFQVPFYQIALHGYVNYAGCPVNLAGEMEQIILESAESGAGLFFSFMSNDESSLQETYYTNYYSSCFDRWKLRFKALYSEYDENMSCIKNSLIDSHEIIAKDVTKTTFDNGYAVFVNFGYKDYRNDDGTVIPSRNYKVQKVGK